MTKPAKDTRSTPRREQDERIANEPLRKPPNLPPDTAMQPLEAHLARLRHPLAVPGIVENGLVRPLDPTAKLPERARVIIIAADAA